MHALAVYKLPPRSVGNASEVLRSATKEKSWQSNPLSSGLFGAGHRMQYAVLECVREVLLHPARKIKNLQIPRRVSCCAFPCTLSDVRWMGAHLHSKPAAHLQSNISQVSRFPGPLSDHGLFICLPRWVTHVCCSP